MGGERLPVKTAVAGQKGRELTMRVFRTTYKARDGQTKMTRRWYVECRDHLATVRRFPAFSDKGQSEALGRQIERLIRYRASGEQPDPQLSRWLEQVPEKLRARFVSIGLLDSARASAGKPLSKHIDDFEQALRDKGDTEQQAKQVASRVRRIVEDSKFQTWTDIQASRVQRCIAELREGEDGISCRTANFYLQAIQQFATWMVRDRRASESPVAHLRGFKAGELREDQRHPRRALELDEARRLLDATSKGPIRFRASGPERAMLYRLAIETGFRAGELRSLTVASFDLDGCTVTVEGRYSKRRRRDTLPLRSETAADLRVFLAGKLPTARAFRMPSKSRLADMVQADLAATEEKDAQGAVIRKAIPYIDESGRYADFHSLRHTTGSFLAAAGVHPKVAQEILRHSRIELTMNIYTHTLHGQQSEAVAKLPDLSLIPMTQAQRATGTDGGPTDLASCLARQPGKGRTSMDDPGQNDDPGPKGGTTKTACLQAENADSDSREGQAAVGFEPTDNGFANRRLWPLGYAARESQCTRAGPLVQENL